MVSVVFSLLNVFMLTLGDLAAANIGGPPNSPVNLTVDDDGIDDPGPGQIGLSDPWENGTSGRPFDSIQEAIEAAVDGACIRVLPGVYDENVDLLGKRLRLIGVDPGDQAGNPYPVIAGVGEGPAVAFIHGEDKDCTLTGFVITHGQGPSVCAILCQASSPTISHCLIVGHRITDPMGSAVVCSDSHAVFRHCTISDNLCGAEAGAMTLVNSPVILTNSIIWGNTPTSLLVQGLGQPVIRYSDIADAWPGQGNIDKDPLFARRGTWSDPSDPPRVVGPNYPGAIWVQGDYHLQSTAGRWDAPALYWVLDDVCSGCIDAGDPSMGTGYEPVPNGDMPNMGAYGGTAQASKSYVTDRPVKFGSLALKTAVERTLGFFDPTPADMLGLISLSANFGYIDDLSGLEHAVSLQELSLHHNRIADLTPLSGLTHLRILLIHNNLWLSDLSGLSGLVYLEELDAHENAIWDLQPLSGLTGIRKLILYQNRISDIGPLTGLTNLEHLDLRLNPLAGDDFLKDLQEILDNNPSPRFSLEW